MKATIRQYTLQLGLFDKDTKRQEIPTVTATNLVHKQAQAHGINGLSWHNGGGMYTHENGTIVYEPNITVIIYDELENKVFSFAKALKAVFNQEAIYVSTQDIMSKAV